MSADRPQPDAAPGGRRTALAAEVRAAEGSALAALEKAADVAVADDRPNYIPTIHAVVAAARKAAMKLPAVPWSPRGALGPEKIADAAVAARTPPAAPATAPAAPGRGGRAARRGRGRRLRRGPAGRGQHGHALAARSRRR
jgi:hypothetical protein